MTVTFEVETGSGSPTANSYASVLNGDDYHEKHLYSTIWTAAETGEKEESLMMATRLLDDYFAWEGTKTSDTQALDFPRFNVFDKDGFLFQSGTLPSALLDATCEFARSLLAADRTAETDDRGFSRIKAGPVEIVVNPGDRRPVVPSVVKRMLSAIGRAVGGASVPRVRV